MQEIEWGECLVPKISNPELVREIRRAGGIITPATEHFLSMPWIARVNIALYAGLLRHFDREMGERIWMTVSQDQSCRYCYASMRAGMRFIGVPEERIRRLDPLDVEILRFARESIRPSRSGSRSVPSSSVRSSQWSDSSTSSAP